MKIKLAIAVCIFGFSLRAHGSELCTSVADAVFRIAKAQEAGVPISKALELAEKTAPGMRHLVYYVYENTHLTANQRAAEMHKACIAQGR